MISMSTVITVSGVTGKQIYDFMLNCTDEQYQNWWKGVHLSFHTVRKYPNDLGNLVYFDEMVGQRRLKFYALVTAANPGHVITWQMKKLILLPAWLGLTFSEDKEGVLRITHTLRVGFSGVGGVFDPLLRLIFSKEFEKELVSHAEFEFTKLVEILSVVGDNELGSDNSILLKQVLRKPKRI